MKFNKWTLGLAAIGVVSLASAAMGDEQKANFVQSALTGTTISGYVDTSMQWNMGTGNAVVPGYDFNSPNKADGFNLDVIQLSISKAMDESEWASGYQVDLWFGPEASALGTTSTGSNSSDFAVRQAYVALRTPVGNGIDWKIGVFDTIIGWETLARGDNPNYTHSYAASIEPQTHTGVLGTYRVNDSFAFSAGVADTVGPAINQRAFFATAANLNAYAKAESYKTYMGSIALTAPKSWGTFAGSTLYAGIVNGLNSSIGASGIAADQTSFYAGTPVQTPVTGLRVGTAQDYLSISGQDLTAQHSAYWHASTVYISYQATEKMTLNLRGEYIHGSGPWLSSVSYDSNGNVNGGSIIPQKAVAATATIQYDLWKNVISRLEFRWDHDALDHAVYGGTLNQNFLQDSRDNTYMLAANIIYKF